jgi:hypothetical protein
MTGRKLLGTSWDSFIACLTFFHQINGVAMEFIFNILAFPTIMLAGLPFPFCYLVYASAPIGIPIGLIWSWLRPPIAEGGIIMFYIALGIGHWIMWPLLILGGLWLHHHVGIAVHLK